MSTVAASLGLRLPARAGGIGLAFVTACVSGVAVYVNAKGVSRFDDATVYTTAKNAVAGAVRSCCSRWRWSAVRADRRLAPRGPGPAGSGSG